MNELRLMPPSVGLQIQWGSVQREILTMLSLFIHFTLLDINCRCQNLYTRASVNAAFLEHVFRKRTDLHVMHLITEVMLC